MGELRVKGAIRSASSSSLGWFGSTFRSLSASVDISPLALGSENGERETRVKDAEALAKPACAERTSLTLVWHSPKLAVKSEWRIGQYPIDPFHFFYISVSRSGAQLSDAARFRARSTSHPVAARDGCTNIPLTAGRGSGERNHSSNRHFSPWTTSVRAPGSARTDQVLGDLRRLQVFPRSTPNSL